MIFSLFFFSLLIFFFFFSMSHPLHNQTNLKSAWKKPTLARHCDKINKENEPPNDYPQLSPTEFQARKKKFATFRFFLDIADPNSKKRIERKIKLLGAVSKTYKLAYSFILILYDRHKIPFSLLNVHISSLQNLYLFKTTCYNLHGI